MADSPDRRLTDITDEEIERLYNIMLRGLERRLERQIAQGRRADRGRRDGNSRPIQIAESRTESGSRI
jgi:hypothetical protein